MKNQNFELHSKKLAAKHSRKAVFADENENYHSNKLFGGLFRIGFVVLFLSIFGIHWNEKITPFLKEKISYVVGAETGKFLALLIVAFTASFLLVMFIKGLYKVLTFSQYNDVYEGKNLLGIEMSQTQNLSNSSIDKVYAFRNSKMANMTPDKAAELYIKTSKLGGSSSNAKAEGFINSKLGGMTPEAGLNFLKGK